MVQVWSAPLVATKVLIPTSPMILMASGPATASRVISEFASPKETVNEWVGFANVRLPTVLVVATS